MTLTQVSTKGIEDGTILNEDINASAAIAGSKISPTFTSGVVAPNLEISHAAPLITLTDTNANSDFQIKVDGGVMSLRDQTNSANRLTIASNGTVGIAGNLDVSSNLLVLGATTLTRSTDNATTLVVTNNGTTGGNCLKLTSGGSGAGTAIFSVYTNNQSTETEVFKIDGAGKVDITGDLSITSTAPQIFLTDSNANSDYAIVVNTGQFRIRDETNSANRLAVNSDGHIDIYGRLDALGGLDVTGNMTVSGSTDGVLNLDTSDSRGAFIRFGQGGSFHNMIGCADGLTSGDKEDLGVRAADNIIFAAGGSSEKMRLDANGKLGIGRTPTFKLDVFDSTNNTLRLGNSSETGHGSHDAKLVAGANYYHNLRLEASSYHFFGFNGSNTVEHFRVRSTGGVTFNGDTADANALDDYEEGTYTITPLNDGGATLNSNRANYTKIGNMVRISGSFTITATNGTNNNQARFSLPFTSSVNSYYVAHGNTITSTGYTGVVLSATIENSAPYMIFNPSVGMASRSWSQLGNNRFDFDIVYRV